ncbi:MULTISPECIES: hypothetical protein [unclassified Halomonas]|uniref:hypothetical protein n=1 Tax=unclassified Halomonas TaxID=2609666 RepID=UPI0021E3C4E4|nr:MULTISPECIES: hypothetical protein [unclassified Halomonas]UYF98464.1 hypothetical protein OCT39_09465 [Halomonas sp. GD1P12]WNL40422.1 hypothetical protein RN346_07610 [Halomonas sp. PAMB 3232]WNL43753.1 hypothetical protein RN347_07575 [Halomonas sp. PAMB 3264]
MQPGRCERVGVAIGLCVLMLSVMPRYVAGGFDTRLTLLLVAIVLVAGAAIANWRMLSKEERKRLPSLLKRLVLSLGLGTAAMGVWHLLMTDWLSWQQFISHAATCGLLLFAVSLGWQRKPSD